VFNKRPSSIYDHFGLDRTPVEKERIERQTCVLTELRRVFLPKA
jgi:hypothetical protein